MRRKYPEWKMNNHGTLENIDYQKGAYILDGKEYELKDKLFPTVDAKDPYHLTPEEEDLVGKLHHSFRISEKLQKHIN